MASAAAIRFEIKCDSTKLSRALDRLRYLSRRFWLEDVERARTAYGARCATIHVTEGEWFAHWLAGMDPAEAVQRELEQIAD